jgi:hypothetical protein
VTRLNDNGTLDTSFGTNGPVETTIAGFDIAKTMLIQPDGKILVARRDDSQRRDLQRQLRPGPPRALMSRG